MKDAIIIEILSDNDYCVHSTSNNIEVYVINRSIDEEVKNIENDYIIGKSISSYIDEIVK